MSFVIQPGIQQVLPSSNASSSVSSSKNDVFGVLDISSPPAFFCSNAEGWGPISVIRFDYTPCAIDAGVAVAAAFGILAGAWSLWDLAQKPKLFRNASRFHLYVNQILVVAAIVAFSASLGFDQAKVGVSDIGSLSSLLSVISLAIVFAIQWHEFARLRYADDSVLLFYFFFLIALFIKTRSLVSQQVHITNSPLFTAFSLGTALSTVAALVESFTPSKRSSGSYCAVVDENDDDDEVDLAEYEEDDDVNPKANANIFSRFFFVYMNPIARLGQEKDLNEEDLYPLNREDRSVQTSRQLEAAYKRFPPTRNTIYLWLAIGISQRASFFWAAVTRFLQVLPLLFYPTLLSGLINFVESYQSDSPDPVIKGVAIVIGLILAQLLQSVLMNQYNYQSYLNASRTKSSLISVVYEKTLRMSSEARTQQSTGTIINLMSVDINKISEVLEAFHQIWIAPLQMIFVTWVLYDLLGWPALTGAALLVALLPAICILLHKKYTEQRKVMGHRDKRIDLMEEIINHMKTIKLFAWGAAFLEKLLYVRDEQEVRVYRTIGVVRTWHDTIFEAAPSLMSLATFATYALTQETPLTVGLAFPAMSLFTQLIQPLRWFPYTVSRMIEASVAARRVQDFLLSEELQVDAVERMPSKTGMGEDTVVVKDGCFSWTSSGTDESATLRRINFTAYKGQLSCIVGRVGSGKSSFIHSLLGDLRRRKGTVRVHGDIAYVAQQPWILNSSVRENILFGHRFDPDFYEKTIHTCCLVEDFTQLPDGDATIVGERGIGLSGGQRARISLARAVYARADVYLLDDVLSAVDSHVGKRILNEVLGPRGILQTKTRILTTNAIYVLKRASYITLLQDGEVTEHGTYAELSSKENGLVYELLQTAGSHNHSQDQEQKSKNFPSSSSSSSSTLEAGFSSSSGEASPTLNLVTPAAEVPESHSLPHPTEHFFYCDQGESISEERPIIEDKYVDEDQIDDDFYAKNNQRRKDSMHSVRRASLESYRNPFSYRNLQNQAAAARDEENRILIRTEIKAEHRESGRVKWEVYYAYFKAAGVRNLFLCLFLLVLEQSTIFGRSIWVKDWAEDNQRWGGNVHRSWYIGIYAALTLATCLFTLGEYWTMYVVAAVRASKIIHWDMARSVFRAPMSYFDVTPTGRLLNRFSSDLDRLDIDMPIDINIYCRFVSQTIFTLLLVLALSPYWVAFALPMVYLFYRYQRFFMPTSCALQRLDSTTRSRRYDHFQQTFSGSSTIRAFDRQKEFSRSSRDQVDSNIRAYLPRVTANRWLCCRLDMIGSSVGILAATVAVVSSVLGMRVSAGLVGLAMAHAMSLPSNVTGVVRQHVELEINNVAMERIQEYSLLEPEAAEHVPDTKPSASWPAEGKIEFDHYATRYREGLDLTLRDVSFSIRAGEKIGIVGRTGAGKSSLTLALFRLIEAAEGRIVIDGIDTSKMGLVDLRGSLSIIPQDAALFRGTLRANLDPANRYSDEELWRVLELSRLREFVMKMDGGLLASISEKGSNLSQGQRQLVSLARAMLATSQVLVLDEATASVDVETDALIQETLRSPLFSDRTILTVAHRINTILDSDRILLLDNGRVMEFGSPDELLAKKGMFYDLVRVAGHSTDTRTHT